METLETLFNFTERYPQVRNGKLQYVFLGGTGVRLNQEMVGFLGDDVRAISDFDIITLTNKSYPVHQVYLEDIFGVTPMSLRTVLNYVTDTTINSKKYYFMDGTFLALTKTCAIDNPREKDYYDITSLDNLGLINFDKLKSLYSRADKITSNSKLVVDSLKWFLENPDTGHIKLFQSFPRFVNLLDEFKNINKVKDKLLSYSEETKNSGYQLASVIYDTHSIIRELGGHERFMALNVLLSVASNSDYRDFDRLVHTVVLPKIRYTSSINKRRKIIQNLVINRQ